jgi:uncharacterized protein (DUF2267 family)
MDQHSEFIQMVMRQTNYSESEAEEKLVKFNNNPLVVIKDFMGIVEKPKAVAASLNQEIYKQLRSKLDDSIREFNKKQDEKLINDIQNNNSSNCISK